MAVRRRDDAPRSEGAHVQPHGRGTGSAVVQERHGPDAAAVLAIAVLEIGDVEHRRLGCGILALAFRRGGAVLVGLRVPRNIVPALGVHDEGAGDGLIRDRFPAHRDGSRGDLCLGLERLELAGFALVGVRRGLLRGPRLRHGQRTRRGPDPQSASPHDPPHRRQQRLLLYSPPLRKGAPSCPTGCLSHRECSNVRRYLNEIHRNHPRRAGLHVGRSSSAGGRPRRPPARGPAFHHRVVGGKTRRFRALDHPGGCPHGPREHESARPNFRAGQRRASGQGRHVRCRASARLHAQRRCRRAVQPRRRQGRVEESGRRRLRPICRAGHVCTLRRTHGFDGAPGREARRRAG